MRDFPLFCTDSGVASLILKKIPYTKEAYIYIRDTQDPDALLKECCDFCKTVGAIDIYATGHDCLAVFPLHTTLLQMQCNNVQVRPDDVLLFPVQENTVDQWRNIYNSRMLNVPNATYLTWLDAKKIAESGSAYFVHEKGELLGIGLISGNHIDVVATVIRGSGEKVMRALCGAISEDMVSLTVAINNQHAMELYSRMGFVPVKQLESWYKII